MRTIVLDLTVLATAETAKGIGRYAKTLALGLHQAARANASFKLYALADLPFLSAPELTQDIPAALESLAQRTRPRSSFSAKTRVRLSLARALTQSNADLVHMVEAQASPWAEVPCKRVVTCHHVQTQDSAAQWYGQQELGHVGQRRRLHRADRVIATSRATTQELITRHNLPLHKIDIIHHGIQLDFWSPEANHIDAELRKQHELEAFLLGVGGVNERKNLETVMLAFRKALRQNPTRKLHFIWAGALDPSERTRLYQAAEQAGVRQYLKLLGYVDDEELAALYRQAIALLYVSHREGFGLPVVEAMAAGCPVLTSNQSSMTEVAGDAALKVDPNDTAAIADAIVLLWGDPLERDRLCLRGQQRAREFSISKMVERTLLTYEKTSQLQSSSD